MSAEHLEFLVEEPSMEVFLRAMLPRFLPDAASFEVYTHQGKEDLLNKLPHRLRGYARWLPATWRLVVVIDLDDDDCAVLKGRMEGMADAAGLYTRTTAGVRPWQVVNRIAIEELEAWYFGDWEAVRAAYPRASRTVQFKHQYRDPDAIAGGTWEALERILKKAGYFESGLRKLELARTLGERVDPERNRSGSFQTFCRAVLEAVT